MKILPNNIAVIEGDTHISAWVEQSGRLDHDQNVLPLLNAYINAGDVVVDCGAFIGDHTIHYSRRVGACGRVIAFEPNPKAFACLDHNMAALANTTVHGVGLSDTTSTIGLTIDANAGASHANADGDLPCVALDSFGLRRCDFIKLDCEGMEPLALKGASWTINLYRPAMLIEINEGALARQGFTPSDIFRFLDGYGYTYRNIYAGQPTAGPQYDIIATARK